MLSTDERVDRLEAVFAQFMERTEEALADIRASTAEIRASNLRTDALLLEMQRQAEKDREQAEMARTEMQRQAEIDRRQAEMARAEMQRQAEKDREQAEMARAEMQRQAEIDRRQAEAHREEMRRQLEQDRQRAEQDRQRAEQDRQRAEQDRKDFNKRLAELSDSMGTLVEDMVAPNARRIAGQIFPADPVVRLMQRLRQVHPTDPGRMIEIDLLAAGRRHLMVVEAKWRLNPEKIREYVERVAEIPEFLPEYAGYQLFPVVASVTIDPSVIVFLNRQRVYGVAMGDETMELVNLGQF